MGFGVGGRVLKAISVRARRDVLGVESLGFRIEGLGFRRLGDAKDIGIPGVVEVPLWHLQGIFFENKTRTCSRVVSMAGNMETAIVVWRILQGELKG